VFSSFRNGSYRLFRRKSNGSGQDELLDSSIESGNTPDWSRDGRSVVFGAQGDLWVLPLQGERRASALQKTPFLEGAPVFSPDGRWIAYRSNESGRFEIYVQPFPATGAKYLVSRNGGLHAAWRGDGQELFFLSPTGTMMASTIKTSPDFRAGVPQALFETEITGERANHAYVVSKDGKRFLMANRERTASTPITVVLNWPGIFD
jgi:Tol biopolymer transport system component